MSHHEKLVPIDIPAARKAVLKSISEYRRQGRLAFLMRQFLESLQGKKVDKRAADKFHAKLVSEAPELKVARVIYTTDRSFGANLPIYKFAVECYEMQRRTWEVRTNETGALLIEDAMVGDAQWIAMADALEERLPFLAARANSFNIRLKSLQDSCVFADGPPGTVGPLYPLSEFFHWYQLHQ